MRKVLAYDFGASSGRAMLGQYEDGRITMTEIHRFSNDPVEMLGTLYWDFLRLFYEVKRGMTKAVQAGGFDSVGIDTWGVDFGLLRPEGTLVGNPVHYRDNRTDDFEICPVTPEDAYKVTGIEIIYFNTIYQLNAVARKEPHVIADSSCMLFMPDLFAYMLGSRKASEYTIASTSGMLNAKTREWDEDLVTKAGIPERLLCEIVMPGTMTGVLNTELCTELGAPAAQIIAVASHDTASAVAAIPTQEKEFIFLSCGTWSLLGTVLDEPLINEKAYRHNFTNEGTVGGKIQFLKNIMGTWLIQESRNQWLREGRDYGFGDLERLAGNAPAFASFIDADDSDYSKPGNIPSRIQMFCERTEQPVPTTPGEIVRCIDESLALKFRYTIDCLRDCTGKKYNAINIVGGGVKSALLCQMTADATGLPVVAGPDEATVLGNIGVQLVSSGDLKDIAELREAISRSCVLTTYEPHDTDKWDEAYKRYAQIVLQEKQSSPIDD